MQAFETLEFELNQGVAVIKLNRPDAANGITLQLAQELLQAAIFCETDSRVRAVLLTGNGKMFSAGGDLKSFAAFGEQMTTKMKELMVAMHAAISKFNNMPAPLIVAVNGMAAGAGFSIAISGDLVYASEQAKFTMAYTAAGLSPDGSASYYLPRLVGLRKAQELMLENTRLDAQQALELGLLTAIFSADELFEKALAKAQTLAAGPTQAFGSVKQLLSQSFNNSLESQMELEAKLMAAMTQTQDGKEGVSAFVEKRAPSYKGQ